MERRRSVRVEVFAQLIYLVLFLIDCSVQMGAAESIQSSGGVLETMDNRKQMKKSFQFNKRVQRENEDFNNFLYHVSQLVKECGYGDLTDRILRDKIISGASDGNLQNHLLGIENLTLEEAKTIATKWQKSKRGESPTSVKSDQQLNAPAVRSPPMTNDIRAPCPSTKEAVLQKINKVISFEEERQNYTKYFDTVRDRILNQLQEDEPAFKSLYGGNDLAGSYADNLKVAHADEFDLQVYLRLREFRSMKVVATKGFPGLVDINMKTMLDDIQKMQQYKAVYDQLKALVDEEGYLIPIKLQSWFQRMFQKVLDKTGKTFDKNGDSYELAHSQSGPAHTLTVTVNKIYKFSIDFVPVIKLLADEAWKADRAAVKTLEQSNMWVAVPKPQKTAHRSFQTSYDKMERSIIKFKKNFKNVDRLLKKIRDRYDINNFKSYYIKTVCLWVNDEVKNPDEFWKKPSYEVLLQVFERIVAQCEKKKMPFFWNRNQNMFSKFNDNQINDMKGKWQNVLKKLKQDDSILIPRLFCKFFV
ncbi:hypothetical protein ACFFRR_001751 [Megaselia abdita]